MKEIQERVKMCNDALEHLFRNTTDREAKLVANKISWTLLGALRAWEDLLDMEAELGHQIETSRHEIKRIVDEYEDYTDRLCEMHIGGRS